MGFKLKLYFSGGIIFISACAFVGTSGNRTSKGLRPDIRVQAGINYGGVVENTDMSEIENAPADAVTGATSYGVHGDCRLLFALGRNKLETGAGLLRNKQSFEYDDDVYGYQGIRTIRLTQIIVPFTYSFGFFRNKNPDGVLQLRLGLAGLLNFSHISDSHEQLPEYETSLFSGGMILGFGYLPFVLQNGQQLGLYFDLYRGSQIYEDMYNKSDFKMKGTSHAKSGILFQF